VSSPKDSDALDIALRVARALEAVGAEYFVGGSVASSLQGDPRSTNDIDFVISLPLGRVDALCAELGTDFEVDANQLREAIRRAGSANAFYLPLITKIDFFGRGYEPYDEAEFSRRLPRQVRTSGETLVIKAPEDTVLRKLLWYRAGGEVSDKQWRDIVSVLRVSRDQIDRTYLETWAARLGIAALLEKASA
jgi:hypothetical protein